MPKIKLPTRDGALEDFILTIPKNFSIDRLQFTRKVYAATHVVANPIASADSLIKSTVDWDATIAYRRYLWSLGLGVAEAMDTAQRGMGLDWPTSLTLIRHTLDAARDVP